MAMTNIFRLTRNKLLTCAVVATGVLSLLRFLKIVMETPDSELTSNELKRKEYAYVVGKTWDGKPLDHGNTRITLRRGSGDVIEMHVQAPFYNAPAAPSGPPGEPFPGLWDYEVVEAFFLTNTSKYLEVEVCPHGQHLILMLNGTRHAIKTQLPAKFDYKISGNEWSGTIYLPLDYFPPKVTKFNAYAIHGKEKDRHYEAYKPVPGPEPDFHRLNFFAPIDFSALAPENDSPEYYSTHWSP